MNWFFIAMIGPMLYAATNHLDKYMLEKYFKDGGIGAVIIFAAIFSVFALPIIFIIHPGVFSVDLKTMAILAANGGVGVLYLLLYLYAIKDDEVSVAAPFFQTIPIFGFILGYFILGEVLSMSQIWAALLIITGAVILSFEIEEEGIVFRKRVVLFMLASSFVASIFSVVFKFVATEQGFWQSIFWSLSGNVFVGVAMYIFIKSYREQFLRIFKINGFTALSLYSLNEVLFILAEGFTAYATLLAPIALVLAVNGLHPLFVFLFAIFLNLFFPKISKESMTKRDLIQKFVAIAIIISGTLFLNLS